MYKIIFFYFLIFSNPCFSEEYNYITMDWCEANFKDKRMYSPCSSIAMSIGLMQKKDIENSLKTMDMFSEQSVEILNQSAFMQRKLLGNVSNKTVELMNAYRWWLTSLSNACNAMSEASLKYNLPEKAFVYYNKKIFYESVKGKIELDN